MRRTPTLILGALLMGCGTFTNVNDFFQPQAGPSNPASPSPSPTPAQVTVATLAGAADPGNINGPGPTARFANPVNVEIDGQSNLFVCDFSNNAVRKIDSTGEVTTLFSDGTFNRPFGITLGNDRMLYVETDGNDQGQRDNTTGTIWRINPVTGTGAVVARNLGRPRGLCTLPDGRLVLSDLGRNVVELMDPNTGVVTPLAGEAGVPGFTNGQGTAAHFSRSYGPAVLGDGSILLADQNNNCIRRVTLSGDVTTFAGTGTAGLQNGTRQTALFNGPQDVSVDAAGNIFVADTNNRVVRRIDSAGMVTTLAGSGTAGFQDGPAATAQFFGLEGLVTTASGKTVFVADGDGGTDDLFNRVRVVLIP